MRIRIKFRKWGVMKFVGHLDMMRYFQKAIRRANIDICYSEGFSPHQIMSFAAPLGVGITSDGEYFDIEVHSSLDTKSSIVSLNNQMVDGVEVTGYVLLSDRVPKAMAQVAAADYCLFYKEGYSSPFTKSEWQTRIEEYFLKADSFTISKKTKKSERVLDLKPLVYQFRLEGSENKPEFHLMVSTGSTDNIKPELVLTSIYQKMGISYDNNAIQIHKFETYSKEETTNQWIPLLDFGEEIVS